MNAWRLRSLMPCPSITPGYTAMQEAKNTMVTSWLRRSQGFGRQFNLQKTQPVSASQPKSTCAMPRSLQLCAKSHVIYTVCCHKARMEKLFPSRSRSHASLPPGAPAVPQPQGRFPQITGLRGRVIVKTT